MPDLEKAGWQHLELPGREPAWFSATQEHTLEVGSKEGVSFLYREIQFMDPSSTHLSWDWRVSQPVPATDLTQSDGDDREIAIHLWFPDEDYEGRSLSLVSFLGSGRALTYVWGGNARRGTRFANPHFSSSGSMIVLRPGGQWATQWITESVDFAADYEKAFGEPPKRLPIFLAVSTDTDDTETESRASVRNFAFTPGPATRDVNTEITERP